MLTASIWVIVASLVVVSVELVVLPDAPPQPTDRPEHEEVAHDEEEAEGSQHGRPGLQPPDKGEKIMKARLMHQHVQAVVMLTKPIVACIRSIVT